MGTDMVEFGEAHAEIDNCEGIEFSGTNGLEGADGVGELPEPESELRDEGCSNAKAISGIRISRKSKGCVSCGGPCDAAQCSVPGSGSTTADQNKEVVGWLEEILEENSGATELETTAPEAIGTDEAADAFMRIAAERKRQREVGGAMPSQSASNTADGRPHGQRGVPKRRRTHQQITLPASYGVLPNWFKACPKIGNVAIDPSHVHLGWHRGLVWCWHCGHTATTVPYKLRLPCIQPTTAGLKQLQRLRKGMTPHSAVEWPLGES
jgi:hypothetical protein